MILRRPKTRAQPSHDELPIRIVVLRPPGGVKFAVQEGRSELLSPSETTGTAIAFEFRVRMGARRGTEAPNFLGSFAQGPRSGRFVYVNSGRSAGQAASPWTRRAKVPLGAITWELVERALSRPGGALEAHIEGTGKDGGPACATVALLDGGWRVVGARASQKP